MSRWNEDTTLRFVREYRERECLWNTRTNIYKNKQAREGAYKEIEKIMGIEGFGVPEIKNKIKALRSTYSQEKKKIKVSKKKGTGSDDVYVPHVKWYKEMNEFLHCLEDNKRPMENNLITLEEVSHVLNDHEILQNAVTEDYEDPTPAKRHPKEQHFMEAVKELKRISDRVIKELPTETEYNIFGRSVAAQLLTLSRYNAIQAQERIQSVLTSYKLQELRDISAALRPTLSPAYYPDWSSSHSVGSTSGTPTPIPSSSYPELSSSVRI